VTRLVVAASAVSDDASKSCEDWARSSSAPRRSDLQEIPASLKNASIASISARGLSPCTL